MGRGTVAKGSKSSGSLVKNAAKAVRNEKDSQVSPGRSKEALPWGARSVPSASVANVASEAATKKSVGVALTDIVGVEAQEENKANGKRELPGKVVHFTEVLAKGGSESDSSEEHSSAEETTPGPLVQTYNPFKSKLSRGPQGRKVAADASADVSKEGKDAEGRQLGVGENGLVLSGDSGVQKKDMGDKTMRVEMSGAVEKGERAQEGNVSGDLPPATAEKEASTGPADQGSKASEGHSEKVDKPEEKQQTSTNPKEAAISPEGPVTENVADARPAPAQQGETPHASRARKQVPDNVVAEIDAIAEKIAAPVPPPKKHGPGLPPRNSISAGAAFLKLHSQGDTSLKSPDGKPKLASAFRDRTHSSAEGGSGGGSGDPPAKGPLPSFWSRFIPVHAFQPGEGGEQPQLKSPPSEVSEGSVTDEVHSKGGKTMQRSVSEPPQRQGGTQLAEESVPVREAETGAMKYARSKSKDSGIHPPKAKTPSSPMSVLSGESTSPRSPHSPTKPPLPPILKTSSRFNGENALSAVLLEEMKELDGEGGQKLPSPPNGGGRLSPNGGRRDSPRRVSFVDDLPTLRKAASFAAKESGPAHGLPKAMSMPRNSEGLMAAAAEANAKVRAEKERGGIKTAEIMQTSDADELLGAFGAAGMDLDGLIKMAEVHLREARKGMSPEAKKQSQHDDSPLSPEPKSSDARTASERSDDAKAPYLSIPDFDEEEWSKTPTPQEKVAPREKNGDGALAASQRAWEGKGREQLSRRAEDWNAVRRASDAAERSSDTIGRPGNFSGRGSDGRQSLDAIGRSGNSAGRASNGRQVADVRTRSLDSSDSFQRSFQSDFGRTSLETLNPVLDTVLERVLAGDEFADALGSESARVASETGEVTGRGKEAKGGQEVIFWGADDEADRDLVEKLEKEKESLQAALDEGRPSDPEQKKRTLRTQRAQLEAENGQLRRKVALQRSLRSSFAPGQRGGSPDRSRDDAEIRQLEEELGRMKRTKDELAGTLEAAKEAEGAAERIWELQEVRAQLEEDLARLMAQKASGEFWPAISPEQAQLENDVARMKQELEDLRRQKHATPVATESELWRLKDERSALELQLANAIGEIALESAMASDRHNPADEYEELNLGLLEEGNARLQQQIQEVKQQAARQRAGIIIGSEERTQALQKLLETRNVYEEELAATVAQIMEEKAKNDEIEKMVHGNMSALERALAQQQQALSEAQEVLQAERARSQTMRATVENISHAAAPAIPGLLKGRAYAAAANAPTPVERGGNAGSHFAINFHNLETGGSDYLSQQLAGSRGLVFRESDIRRRIHDDASDSDSATSRTTSRSGDNFHDHPGELALIPPRITELPSPTKQSTGHSRSRSEVAMGARDPKRTHSGPQFASPGALAYQLESAQERRNQILKQFSGPLDEPAGRPRMSVGPSKQQQQLPQQRPKSAGPVLNNRYSLG